MQRLKGSVSVFHLVRSLAVQESTSILTTVTADAIFSSILNFLSVWVFMRTPSASRFSSTSCKDHRPAPAHDAGVFGAVPACDVRLHKFLPAVDFHEDMVVPPKAVELAPLLRAMDIEDQSIFIHVVSVMERHNIGVFPIEHPQMQVPHLRQNPFDPVCVHDFSVFSPHAIRLRRFSLHIPAFYVVGSADRQTRPVVRNNPHRHFDFKCFTNFLYNIY